MKVLIDMNLSPRWADTLRHAGVESVHWSSVGSPAAPDRDLMEYARARGFVVLTADLDFGAILAATGGGAPSVLQIRGADLRPESLASKVIAAFSQLSIELGAGALVTIDAARTRLRVLPLKNAGALD